MREANEALLLAALQAREAAEQSSLDQRRQTEFMHRLAHELRAPLAPLRHVVGLLGHTNGGDTLPYARDLIERQVSHLAQMVDDLLDAARLRTGKLSLRLARIDLRDVLAGAALACRPAVALRSQVLTLHMPPAAVAVHGDTVRLGQVFGNLLSNASKYSPHGGRIELTMRTDADGVGVALADNGIGIAPEALDSIFEAYVQAPHAVRHDDSGLGLGLTLARELVLAHGGRIRASSAGVGQGTRLDVHLPLAEPLPAALHR